MNSISFKRPSGQTVTSQNVGGAHFQTISKPLDTVAARFEHIADQYGDRNMTVDEIVAAMDQAVDREGIRDRLGEAGCLPNLESWGLDPKQELDATLAYKAPEAHDQFAENMRSKSCLAAVQGDDKYLDAASLLAAEEVGTKHINDQVNDANNEAAKAIMKEQAAKPETGGKPEAGAKPAAGAKPETGGKPDSSSKSDK